MIVVVGADKREPTVAGELPRRCLPYRVLERHTVGASGRTPNEVAHLPGRSMAAASPRARSLFRFRDSRARFAGKAVILATRHCPTITFIARELRCDRAGRSQGTGQPRARGNSLHSCAGFRYPLTAGWLRVIGRVVRTTAGAIARRTRRWVRAWCPDQTRHPDGEVR